MLEVFRNKSLSSIVYGVVIVGTVAAFVLNFGPNAGRPSKGIREALNETCAVKVAGSCVDPKIHRGTYRLLMPRDRDGATDANRARAMGLSKIVADGLIERELLAREAERIGLTVTEREVEDSIVNGYILVSTPSDNPMLSYYVRTDGGKLYAGFRDPKTKRFSTKTYEKQVKMLTGVSTEEFRDWQGRELLAAKMRDLVRAPVRVSDAEVFEKFVREKSTASVSYIAVKQSFATKYLVKDTQAEVDAYIKDDTHRKEVEAEVAALKEQFSPKEGHIRHILVKVAPTASDEAKSRAAEKLARALDRIAKGDAFASVAREFSEDTSAMSGGDVGDKTDGFVVPFRDAANALKPGQMTDGAIESQFGYHIIYKDDPSKASSIEAQLKKDFARHAYLKSKGKELAKDMATQLMTSLKAGTSDEDAVKAVMARFDGYKTPVWPAVKIKLMTPEAPPSASGDAGAGDAASGDAGTATASAGAAFRMLTPKSESPEADIDRPKLDSTLPFVRGGDSISTLQGEDAPKVSEFAFKAKPGELLPDVLKSEGDCFLVRAKEHKDATREDFMKDKDGYTEELLHEKRSEALGLYVKRLREAAKNDIKTFDENMVDAKVDGGAAKPTPEDDEGP
jgi:peptidyl-prolyl cis-trans isomerase D